MARYIPSRLYLAMWQSRNRNGSKQELAPSIKERTRVSKEKNNSSDQGSFAGILSALSNFPNKLYSVMPTILSGLYGILSSSTSSIMPVGFNSDEGEGKRKQGKIAALDVLNSIKKAIDNSSQVPITGDERANRIINAYITEMRGRSERLRRERRAPFYKRLDRAIERSIMGMLGEASPVGEAEIQRMKLPLIQSGFKKDELNLRNRESQRRLLQQLFTTEMNRRLQEDIRKYAIDAQRESNIAAERTRQMGNIELQKLKSRQNLTDTINLAYFVLWKRRDKAKSEFLTAINSDKRYRKLSFEEKQALAEEYLRKYFDPQAREELRSFVISSYQPLGGK